jgi:hypothetical protein
VTFGNGTVQSFAYDAASRLATLSNNLSGTSHDLTQTFNYNPAGQIADVTRSNDAYGWQAHYNVDRAYIADGLNRIMSAGIQNFAYDARGNLSGDGVNSYYYTAENRLSVVGPQNDLLVYEPGSGMLYQHWASGVDTRFAWSGIDMLLEINGATDTILRRYVHGPGIDNPIVWYEVTGTSAAAS